MKIVTVFCGQLLHGLNSTVESYSLDICKDIFSYQTQYFEKALSNKLDFKSRNRKKLFRQLQLAVNKIGSYWKQLLFLLLFLMNMQYSSLKF